MATQTVARREVDPDKLNAMLGQAVQDMAAAWHGAVIVLGDRLGLYRAMADGQPVTPAELAKTTGTAERYVREWLNANAAGHYVDFDPATGTYSMNPEQAFILGRSDTPVQVAGSYQMLASIMRDEDKLVETYRTGKGFGWHEHDKGLFDGCERFFRPGYMAHLTSEWIPSLEGVEAKLNSGAKVADVGCGHGASTLLMAQKYPRSKFHGFDYHPGSIEQARARAAEMGLQDRATFEVAASKVFPGSGYDLVCCFDCLHDMGDPVGAARHVQQALAQGGASQGGTSQGGTWMIVEPFANDDVQSNLNPVGRIFYSASATICVPASLSQEVALGLGAQAGEARIREVVTKGGFSHFRRAAETPFNLVYEARV